MTASQDEAQQDISLIYQPGDGSIPVITKTAAEVCAPEQFYDAQGTLQTGSKNCATTGSGAQVWDAVNTGFPGSGYFTSATLPPITSVCSTGKTGGVAGTATCQTGSPTGTNPDAGEILSGKSAWSSTGSVIDGSMANRGGAWSLTSAWPGSGYFDTAPTFPESKVCDDTSLLGTTGTASCGGGSSNYKDVMKSTAHRTLNANQVSLITEASTGLSSDYRRVPDILLDDDGAHASSPVVKQTRPLSNCGTTGTIEQRITNCNTAWSGKTNGTSGEGDWKLVTRIDTPAVYEVWRDERTGLIWSDRVGDPTSPIDPDSDDFTANWCQASGNAQSGDPNMVCDNPAYQNQATPESWCGDEARGAPMKGNIGSAQNITWRLPTKSDWALADVNGIRFVLPHMVSLAGTWSFYWSATIDSSTINREAAWTFRADTGYLASGGRMSGYDLVRCVGGR